MASSFSISGLMSGLDTDAIIKSLVDVKTAQLITPLQNRIIEINAEQTALETIVTAATSMRSAANSLNGLLDFDGRSGTSSDTDVLTIDTLSTSCAQGTYNIQVNQLAQSDRVYFNGVADMGSTQHGTGTITITSSGETINVTIDATNNTLEGIRDAINNASGSVTATIVNDGGANPYRLVLISNETGAASNITHNIGAPAGFTLVEDAALTGDASNTATDAEVVINAMTVASASNTITDAISGLSFSILDDTGNPTVKVIVSSDFTTAHETVATFINAYNEVVAKLKDQFSYDETTGQSTGTLAGDLTLQSIQYNLNTMMVTEQTQLAGNAYRTLSDVGITMDEDGYLVIDQNEFYEKMAEDLDGVERLFQGMSSTVGGIADTTYEYLYTMTNTADGLLQSKSNIWQEVIDDYLDDIDDRTDRIETYEATLRSKFAYMEQTLLGLQQQSTALDSMEKTLDSLTAAKNS
ncbi:MAG: flagellar filament capping protein FliD [Deltaproteobacteria bacterium]|nr:flagellar filament capping protein FliD [Deltaproteobacteria bacterium]